MAAVTKEMSIGEVVMKWPESAGAFLEFGSPVWIMNPSIILWNI